MAKYDLILKGGTVLDPANGFEGVSDVGIAGGKIERVAPELDPFDSDDLIDVSGKWVMPGQIDTHAHVAGLARNWDPAIGYSMLARAGTTTVLDMGGTGPNLIDGIKRRGAGLNVAGQFAMTPGATIPNDNPSPSQLRDIVANALRQGCFGLKILGGYHPFTPEKTAEIIRACNEQRAYIAFHLGTKESGSHLGGVREIPELVGGGRLHVCHVNSYCRGVIEKADEECAKALSILESMRGQLNSEAYHAIPNGTSGLCDKDGNVVADVPRNCLRLRGYPTTREGMRQAILDGYGAVLGQKGGQIMYIKGKEALDLYEQANTNIGMSFPVNLPSSAFRLSTARNERGEYIVDAVSTDGGSHPRNVAIQSTMALTQFGAFTPLEMATKLSWTPARMLGLLDKGHFSEGADADITVLDPRINQPVMSLVAGRLIMLDGRPVGSGGTLLVTSEGEHAAKDSGLPYQVIDLSKSKLYAGYH
ncbi:MAG: amidohydrolase family protein [Chloroflexi bacterium]|nr:amidohydrolase family protein [Chloroflexota bacterium]